MSLVQEEFDNRALPPHVGLCFARLIVGALLIMIFLGAAFIRNKTWSDDLSIWFDSTEKSDSKRGARHAALTFAEVGRQYFERGAWGLAVVMYRKALERRTELVAARFMLGVSYTRMNRYVDALQEFKAVAASNPSYEYVHYNLGLTYGHLGDLDRAIEELMIAVKERPDFNMAHLMLGTAYYKKNMWWEALQCFDKAASIYSEDAQTLYYRGAVYRAMGDDAHTLKDFKKACELGHQKACEEFVHRESHRCRKDQPPEGRGR